MYSEFKTDNGLGFSQCTKSHITQNLISWEKLDKGWELANVVSIISKTVGGI